MPIFGTDGPIATASRMGSSTVMNFKSDGAFFQTSPNHRQDFGTSADGCSEPASSSPLAAMSGAGGASKCTAGWALAAQSGAAWRSSITGMLSGRAEFLGKMVLPGNFDWV